ncbi:MAG: hypothetical protein M3Z20_08355, partial [Chloroflexota bacterium]|nr:hypothetical protein [Chloroflexota bacterium]
MTATTTATETLPRWDLDALFPGPDSPEIRAAMQAVQSDAAGLLAALEEAGGAELTAETLGQIIDQYNALLNTATRIEGYLYCLVAADVTDEAASAASSSWDLVKADLGGIAPRFTTLLGSVQLDDLAAQSQTVAEHLPTLSRVQQMGAHLMLPGEEELAAQLDVAGAAAWSSLRDELGGRATVTIEVDGEPQEMALSEAGNFAYDPDRSARQRADAAVNAAWDSLGVPLAAAINAVKGQQRVLASRRGWDDPLDVSLAQNAIDRETLNAMQTAIREAVPDYQRYLRAKARLLGVPLLAGYDFDAPVGEPMAWPYARAQEFVLETFAAEHQPLADLAQRA